MKKIDKNMKVSLPIIWVGLKNDWLSLKESFDLINDNYVALGIDEDSIITINLKENKHDLLDAIHDLIKENGDLIDDKLNRIWHFSFLNDVHESSDTIASKLRKIELLWSRFDYIPRWRDFIYYLPNDDSNSEEDVYQKFIKFIKEEKEYLSRENI